MGNKYDDLNLKDLRVEIDGNVAIIYLNRPKKRNGFTTEIFEKLPELFKMVDEDPQIRAVVFTGQPNEFKTFCAGADLNVGNFSTTGPNSRHSDRPDVVHNVHTHRDRGGHVALSILNTRKPTIAAINGHAAGIGITSTLPFDIRIAWKDAKIGFVFSQRGIVPESCSTYFLPRLIGYSSAFYLLTRGQIFPANNSIHGNLFHQLTDEPEQVLPEALKLAHEMADSTSSMSISVIKSLLWRSAETPEGQHLLDSRAMYVLGNTTESQERIKAFMEKRKGPLDDDKRTTADWPESYNQWWTTPDIKSKI